MEVVSGEIFLIGPHFSRPPLQVCSVCHMFSTSHTHSVSTVLSPLSLSLSLSLSISPLSLSLSSSLSISVRTYLSLLYVLVCVLTF
jgi:hypothetical protein